MTGVLKDILRQFDGFGAIESRRIRRCGQDPGKIGCGIHLVGINLQAFSKFSARFVLAALLEQREPEIVMSVGISGIDLQRFLAMNDRFIQSAAS